MPVCALHRSAHETLSHTAVWFHPCAESSIKEITFEMLHHRKKLVILCAYWLLSRGRRTKGTKVKAAFETVSWHLVALTETDFSRININTDCYLLNKAAEWEIKGITVWDEQSHGGAARRDNPGKSPEMGQRRMWKMCGILSGVETIIGLDADPEWDVRISEF